MNIVVRVLCLVALCAPVLAAQEKETSVKPPEEKGDRISRHVKGSSKIVCDSTWHPKMALELVPAGRLILGAEELAPFRPTQSPAMSGDAWTVKADRLLPFATALTDIPWKIGEGGDENLLLHWRGSMPRNRKIAVTGELAVKAESGDRGLSLIVSGTLTVTDTGNLGNRFGPNDWKFAATHTISGSFLLDGADRIAGVAIKDDVVVAGSYGQGSEPFTQQTSIETVEPGPLTDDLRRQADDHIAKLSDEDYETREEATKVLIAMGDEIEPLLRAALFEATDAEVKGRLAKILESMAEQP